MKVFLLTSLLYLTLSACTGIPESQVVAAETACTTPVQATGSNMLKRKACPTAEGPSDPAARESAEAMRDDQRFRNMKKIPNQG